MQELFKRDGTQVSLLQDVDLQSSSNYLKLPDGTLIQYGEYITENTDRATIYFNIPFIDTKYSICIEQSWFTIHQTRTLNNKQKTSCEVVFFNSELTTIFGGHRGNYIAIGRWK